MANFRRSIARIASAHGDSGNTGDPRGQREKDRVQGKQSKIQRQREREGETDSVHVILRTVHCIATNQIVATVDNSTGRESVLLVWLLRFLPTESEACAIQDQAGHHPVSRPPRQTTRCELARSLARVIWPVKSARSAVPDGHRKVYARRYLTAMVYRPRGPVIVFRWLVIEPRFHVRPVRFFRGRNFDRYRRRKNDARERTAPPSAPFPGRSTFLARTPAGKRFLARPVYSPRVRRFVQRRIYSASRSDTFPSEFFGRPSINGKRGAVLCGGKHR